MSRKSTYLGMDPCWTYGPSWRWDSAGIYLERQRQPPKRAEWTVHAVHLLRGQPADKPLPKPLSRRWVAALRQAIELRGDEEARITIEALVLAGVSTRQIAHRLGAPPRVIAEYERCLFAAREVLHHRALVMCKVIDVPNPLRPPRDQAILRAAYLGGPQVAEHWLGHLHALGKGRTHDLTTPAGLESERLELMVLAEQVARPTDSLTPTCVTALQQVHLGAARHTTFADRFADWLDRVTAEPIAPHQLAPVAPYPPFRRRRRRPTATANRAA